MFLCVKSIPCCLAILGLFGYSLVGLWGMPVFEGKTGLEHRLERFFPVESEGSRQEMGVWE